MFFADPAGAVVGKFASRNVPNPRWIGAKTVCGSMAVMVVTFFTILYPVALWERGLLAVAAMVAEAVAMVASRHPQARPWRCCRAGAFAKLARAFRDRNGHRVCRRWFPNFP